MKQQFLLYKRIPDFREAARYSVLYERRDTEGQGMDDIIGSQSPALAVNYLLGRCINLITGQQRGYLPMEVFDSLHHHVQFRDEQVFLDFLRKQYTPREGELEFLQDKCAA